MAFSETAYLYVDGESHFEGASKCWEKLHPEIDLGSMCHEILNEQVSNVRFYPKAKFFWYDGLLAALKELVSVHFSAVLRKRIGVSQYW